MMQLLWLAAPGGAATLGERQPDSAATAVFLAGPAFRPKREPARTRVSGHISPWIFASNGKSYVDIQRSQYVSLRVSRFSATCESELAN
jgi:hypothetical protein